MDYHSQGHSHDREQGLQGNHRQTVESAVTNLSSVGPLSFESQVYNTKQALWGMDGIQSPYFEPTSELQGMSRASRRRRLTFPKGQVHPLAAYGPYVWHGPPERYHGAGPSVPLGLLPAEDQLDALLNAPINFSTLNDANVQMSQAQILYSGDVDPAYGRRKTSAEPMPGRMLAGDVPNAISTSSRSGRTAGGPIEFLDPTMTFDPLGAEANPLLHDNTEVQRGRTNRGDGPAHDVIDVNIMSLRLRGVRLPPQTYEKDVVKLYHRLIYEGADSRTAVILRDVIFAAEVTVDALMAPIQKRELSIEYGGAKRMWQMLLEKKEVVPGQVKYFCLLCPFGGCRGYNLDRDAVRHFNREHFGFSFPCEHW